MGTQNFKDSERKVCIFDNAGILWALPRKESEIFKERVSRSKIGETINSEGFEWVNMGAFKSIPISDI